MDKRPWQFGTRTILFVMLIVGGFIASVHQYGGGGLFLFVLGLGVVLMISAIWNRKVDRGLVGLLMILIALPYFGSAARYVDETTCDVQVVVTDARNGQPLSGARVSIYKAARQSPTSYVPTDRAGAAMVSATFRSSIYEFGLMRSGRVWLWEHRVLVETPGYETQDVYLHNLAGHTHSLYGDPLPPVRVELSKTE